MSLRLMARAALLFAWLTPSAGCGSHDPPASVDSTTDTAQSSDTDGTRPSGETGPTGETGTSAPSANPIFLDWCDGGCTLTPAAVDDARTGGSTLVSSTTTVSSSTTTPAQRAEVLTCLRALFENFDAAIDEADPGPTVVHRQVMVGTSATQLGLPSEVRAVAPFDCQDHETAIVVAFANPFASDMRGLCEAIAQSLGAAVGLELVYECPDVMSYLSGCGDKSFTDQDAGCGDTAPHACQCGGSSQNSHQVLIQRLGPAPR